MVEEKERPEGSTNKPGNILTPETLAMRFSAMGREKDIFLGALHNRIANWGAGFLDYHVGFMWGGFRRYALRQRGLAREHFREFIEKRQSAGKNFP